MPIAIRNEGVLYLYLVFPKGFPVVWASGVDSRGHTFSLEIAFSRVDLIP